MRCKEQDFGVLGISKRPPHLIAPKFSRVISKSGAWRPGYETSEHAYGVYQRRLTCL